MTITRADVADLRVGDVVEVGQGNWTVGTVLRGPLWQMSGGGLGVGDVLVRHGDGRPNTWQNFSLTVISRAKPPLYVNSDKTEPDPGDVVRDEHFTSPIVLLRVAGYQRHADRWLDQFGNELTFKGEKRLRLLVDGRTGQVVL